MLLPLPQLLLSVSPGKNPTLRPNGCYPAHHSKDTMFPLTDEGYYFADMESHYVETWEAMEKLVDEKLTRTIGLSNFNRLVRDVSRSWL